MKIQALLFVAAFLLFTTFVQDTEGAFGGFHPGRRELKRQVCTPQKIQNFINVSVNILAEGKPSTNRGHQYVMSSGTRVRVPDTFQRQGINEETGQ